ncbi:aldo/keto reductase [Jiulongibacter sediminis]|uniref:Aldehyde oxidoreductase n=1 Tax=Jiulongibacter sediminis TaxID=1605367 RepID=A0A0N8HA43_9BACT|nr:aldo/keto reductase [Jiulongibacter sediminis]KPM49132.1 aldehyde oxidoreductase [Jiulongibacter sediminis]TBX26188.1 aldehyde oxidoreductase [Jiulongibacter sediminis]
MKYLQFNNGDKIPSLGLGTWKSKPGEVYEAVREAIRIGYTHFDCAHVYGNEEEIGQAFTDAFAAGETSRDKIFVTSKLWNNRHRTEQVKPALELTLKNLQLDYLDLYLIHWPVVLKDDSMYPQTAEDLVSLQTTPLEDTWKGMIAVKETGLTKHIGVSNFSPAKIKKVEGATGVRPEMNQVESHLFHQQNELKTFCDQSGILFTAYSPLGSADRPANRIADNEPRLFDNETIKKIAEEVDASPAQVMLAWAVNRGTSVIPKSVNPERLKQNLAAADIDLSEDQMNELAKVNKDYRYIKGDFWCIEGSDYSLESLWG